MTRFFNLESYFECCQNTKIFNENSNNFIPSQGNNSLPLAYKNFYQTYKEQDFLLIPALLSQLPQKLQPRHQRLSKEKLGFNIIDDHSEEIFIIREANSLVLRSLQSSYLYANVYRYWNYATKLEKYTLSNKPMVIYDFDSFTPSQIIPLTFEKHPQSPFSIPIIDTRNLEEYDNLKLNLKYEEIYDDICLDIANLVIREFNLYFNLFEEITDVLKKINIFNYINQDGNLSELPLIISIQDQYYNYNLSLNNLSKIVLEHFPLQELTQIINNYGNQYNFVLLGSYTKLASIFHDLQQYNLIIPDNSQNDFPRIWEEARSKNFPLYGQHLDNISFFVMRKNEKLEIKLPSQICYQGQQEVIVYGEYTNLENEVKNDFPLNIEKVDLPFNINKQPLINDDSNKEQIYKIENQYFQQTPELDIKIRFRLKPGIAPKLEVIDQNNRILKSSLQDQEETTSDNLGYIPFESIVKFREEKSQQEVENFLQLNSTFVINFHNFLENISSEKSLNNPTQLAQAINIFIGENKQYFPTIFLCNHKNSMLDSISIDYQKSNRVVALIFNKLREQYYKIKEQYRKNKKRNLITKSMKLRQDTIIHDGYRDLLIFLGISYSLTNKISLDFMYDPVILTSKKPMSWEIHLQNLARVCCILARQQQFFNLFYLHSEYREKYFYQTNEYIWGYARVLLWYVDFNNSQGFLEYNKHFNVIVEYCLNVELNQKNKNYLQDALIALIYLLTFRENDPNFVSLNSPEYSQAKQLCQRLQSFPIRSKKANIDIPLNEFFEKILDGKATAEDTERMLTID
jgi:hypothetical protein